MDRGIDDREEDFRISKKEEEKNLRPRKGYSPLPLGPVTRIYEYMRKHFKVNPFRQKRGEIRRIMNRKIRAMDQIVKRQKTIGKTSPKRAEVLAREYRQHRKSVWGSKKLDVYKQIQDQIGSVSSQTKAHRRDGKIIRSYNRTYEKWGPGPKDYIRRNQHMPTRSIVRGLRENNPDMSITTSKVAMMKSRIKGGLA